MIYLSIYLTIYLSIYPSISAAISQEVQLSISVWRTEDAEGSRQLKNELSSDGIARKWGGAQPHTVHGKFV